LADLNQRKKFTSSDVQRSGSTPTSGGADKPSAIPFEKKLFILKKHPLSKVIYSA
jgi:hypothetical protein